MRIQSKLTSLMKMCQVLPERATYEKQRCLVVCALALAVSEISFPLEALTAPDITHAACTI